MDVIRLGGRTNATWLLPRKPHAHPLTYSVGLSEFLSSFSFLRTFFLPFFRPATMSEHTVHVNADTAHSTAASTAAAAAAPVEAWRFVPHVSLSEGPRAGEVRTSSLQVSSAP
jgi:hypothetical protein